MSEAAGQIRALIEATVESLGFELVRVTYGGGRKPTLQIMAERPDGTMSVEDCATLSREVSLILDVEDPLQGEYLLEVSSPGIDRPLTRAKDFERWVGFDVKVEMNETIDDRRRFRGRMTGFDGDTVTLNVDGEKTELAFADIAKAKLILTDELLAAVQESKSAPGTEQAALAEN